MRFFLTSCLALLFIFIDTGKADTLDLKNKITVYQDKPTTNTNKNNRMWYFSWGYSKDYWSNSNIHVSQPSLNNDFTLHQVTASDDPGWNTGLFNKSLMSPQYNIRIGRYLNVDRTWGIEFSFDHTKYNTNLYQQAYISGMVNGQQVNSLQTLNPTYFNYLLHNGFNNLMINGVRRKPFFNIPGTHIEISGVGKFGLGLIIPHPDNTIFGNKVDVGPKTLSNSFKWRNGWWQMGGWTVGLEFGFQAQLFKALYIELSDKEAYNDLSDIQVYRGRADQTLWLNELILNLGVNF